MQRLLELERVRMRIATDLHDDIGASLSHISVLSEIATGEVNRLGLARNGQRLSEPLSRIASVSRELIDSMSDIVWAISPRKDHLRSLTQRMREFAGEVLLTRDIDLDFRTQSAGISLETKLDPEVRRQVFLIFKECVNNIVRHSDPTRVVCDFRIEGGQLVLRLSDNGQGFRAAVDGLDSEGHGLLSMRRRAGTLGGRLEVAAERNKGVTVVLQVPLSLPRRFFSFRHPSPK
jgi:signal transduction histidine kinase